MVAENKRKSDEVQPSSATDAFKLRLTGHFTL